MDLFTNLDLLSVGIAIAGTALLGGLILLNNFHSATNRAFFYFAFITVCWSIVNYAYYHIPAGTLAFWLLRLVIFFATLHAFTFLNLSLTFPETKVVRSWWYKFILFPIVIATAFLTLTPLVFKEINTISSNGTIGGVQNGPGIAIFGTVILGLVISAIVMLARKTWTAPKSQRRPYSLLFYGMLVTFGLLLTFNLIIPAVFNNPNYIQFGALFLLPFVLSSSFSILRYHLFNIRVAAIGVLSFALSMAILINVLFATSLASVIFSLSEFVLVLIFSFWLIQSVLREVRQREKIEELAKELTETNERQDGLIHFISHEVKGFLARYMAAFAGLADGDYGSLPDPANTLVKALLPQSRKDSRMVMDLLQASNLKKGTISFQMEQFNCRDAILSIIEKLKPSAEAKSLLLNFLADQNTGQFMISGDKEKLSDHVFQNLIENSINYTPKGSVTVSLIKNPNTLSFMVQDTGIGLSEEDKGRLFTEGGHGKESSKINAHSTGYGLFIAKGVVEAHHGKIWAESDGPGKGSRFIVELPLTQAPQAVEEVKPTA